MTRETTDLQGPELIYCCECRLNHPYSAQFGGRDIALRDGWLMGDEGWYCLRCNAGAGEKVLH